MSVPAIADTKMTIQSIGGDLGANIMTAVLISNGFIMVSLIWASGLAFAIDRRMRDAAITFGLGAVLTLFGIIHSPKPDAGLFLPTTSELITETWRLAPGNISYMWQLVAGYVLTAAVFVVWSFFVSSKDVDLESSEAR
jgi:AGZA family xanthine/uracil permease-like MFS transporter